MAVLKASDELRDPLEIAMGTAVPTGTTWLWVGRLGGEMGASQVLVSQPDPEHWIFCQDSAHGERVCTRLDIVAKQLVELTRIIGERIWDRDPLPSLITGQPRGGPWP